MDPIEQAGEDELADEEEREFATVISAIAWRTARRCIGQPITHPCTTGSPTCPVAEGVSTAPR